jgi:hypothetical protein
MIIQITLVEPDAEADPGEKDTDEEPSGMEDLGGLPTDGMETPEETRLREQLADRKQKMKLHKEQLETAQREVIKLQVEKETKVISRPLFNVTLSLCNS